MSTPPESEVHQTLGQNFEQLDQAMQDPFITNALKEASEFNELLHTEGTTATEARDIVSALDMMWGPLNGAEMTVTGNVTFYNTEGELKTHFYEDVEMVSKGFVITGEDTDESIHGRQIQLGFFMEIPAELKQAYSFFTDGSHLIGMAEVDQVELVVNGYSFERAKAWLSVFAPHLIEDIDVAIMNNDTLEETLFSLQGFVFPRIDGDDDQNVIAHKCLSVYLSEVLSIEQKVPYVVQISGHVIIKDEEDNDILASITTETRLVYIHNVVVLESAIINSTTLDSTGFNTEIYLQATLINHKTDSEDLQARVPLESLNSFVSVRDLI